MSGLGKAVIYRRYSKVKSWILCKKNSGQNLSQEQARHICLSLRQAAGEVTPEVTMEVTMEVTTDNFLPP